MELKNKITEKALKNFNSRLDEVEKINELKVKQWNSTKKSSKKKKIIFFLKKEGNLRNHWNNIKWNNIHITGVTEEKKEKGAKTYLKQ